MHGYKFLFIYYFLFGSFMVCIAQNNSGFAKEFYLGSSISYVTNPLESLMQKETEISIMINSAVSINKFLNVGINYNRISYNVKEDGMEQPFIKKQFDMLGGFVQLSKAFDKILFYGELGVYVSDLCYCGQTNYAENRKGLYYIARGFGLEYNFYNHFYLELGISFYSVLNNKEVGAGTYNIPILGINYRFVSN